MKLKQIDRFEFSTSPGTKTRWPTISVNGNNGTLALNQMAFEKLNLKKGDEVSFCQEENTNNWYLITKGLENPGWILYKVNKQLSFRSTKLARAINLSRLSRDKNDLSTESKIEIIETCTFRYKLNTECAKDGNGQKIPGTYAIIGGVNLTTKNKLIQKS